jgi:ribosomal protein S21
MAYIHVYRDPKESFERMLSRFKKLLQRSHKIQEAKEKMRFKKAPTKRYIRQAAIMREYYRGEKAKKMFY